MSFKIGDRVIITWVGSGLFTGDGGYYHGVGDTGVIVRPPHEGHLHPFVRFNVWTGRHNYRANHTHNCDGKPAFWVDESCLTIDDTLFSEVDV